MTAPLLATRDEMTPTHRMLHDHWRARRILYAIRTTVDAIVAAAELAGGDA
jgi:hypothetical protein